MSLEPNEALIGYQTSLVQVLSFLVLVGHFLVEEAFFIHEKLCQFLDRKVSKSVRLDVVPSTAFKLNYPCQKISLSKVGLANLLFYS